MTIDMIEFNLRTWASLVDNRAYDYSEFRRMCQSATVEIKIPRTEYHLIAEVTTSLLPWHAKPDAWEVTTDGPTEREKVFPYAEWVDCPECGEEVINDDLDDHIAMRHEGEHRRFQTDNTRDEYSEK